MPFISVLIPCHNEETFIAKCIDSILANDYQADRMEIFVIDGISVDNTISVITEYSSKFSHIRILSNPKKIFPAAVNIGIRASHGDFIFIMGAHAEYPPNYFSECVSFSVKNNADNVGGILKTIPVSNDFIGSMVSIVLSNPFGVGNSKFRTGSDKITEVDTVFGGCYRKEVFEKYGLFKEELISTSDYEYNKRIRKKGAKIFLDPDIVVNYYTRSTITAFIKNNIRNGIWAVYPIAPTDHFPVSLRHLIPMLFIIILLVSILLSFYFKCFLILLLAITVVYLFTALVFSVKSSGKQYHYILFMPFLFLGLHLTYGFGSILGLIKAVFKKIKKSIGNH